MANDVVTHVSRVPMQSKRRSRLRQCTPESRLCTPIFVLRTHLMHVFGEGDPMRDINVQEQELRYTSLRQGERELTSSFKLRFDNQLLANEGAGVAAVGDA